MGSESSPRGLQTEAHGVALDSVLSKTVQQDAKTFVAQSPDPSILFIPAAEDSSDVSMKIRSYLGADLTIIFGEFPVGILVISKFNANLPIGRFVWDYCCGISYQGSSASYRG